MIERGQKCWIHASTALAVHVSRIPNGRADGEGIRTRFHTKVDSRGFCPHVIAFLGTSTNSSCNHVIFLDRYDNSCNLTITLCKYFNLPTASLRTREEGLGSGSSGAIFGCDDWFSEGQSHCCASTKCDSEHICLVADSCRSQECIS
jgi:hypothetical protein